VAPIIGIENEDEESSYNFMNDTRKSPTALIADGIFIILPVLLLGLVFAKVYSAMRDVIHPLLDSMPGTLFHNPSIRFLAVVLAIAGLLILIGLLAQTQIGRSIGRALEKGFLNRLPFYSLLRKLALGLAGSENENTLKPVLVMVEEGIQQMGFIVEHHADGKSTVFLPSSPNTSGGSVSIVEAALIQELNVPAMKIFRSLNQWGQGVSDLVDAKK